MRQQRNACLANRPRWDEIRYEALQGYNVEFFVVVVFFFNGLGGFYVLILCPQITEAQSDFTCSAKSGCRKAELSTCLLERQCPDPVPEHFRSIVEEGHTMGTEALYPVL